MRKLKTRVLEPGEISTTGEIEYIIGRAMQGKGVVVSLRELIFFSLAEGDAWLLDARDDLALQLAQEGQKLSGLHRSWRLVVYCGDGRYVRDYVDGASAALDCSLEHRFR
jgi:hypothetical protein